MEQTSLTTSRPAVDATDPETFSRVWQRVMPDQTSSPVQAAIAQYRPPVPPHRPPEHRPPEHRPPEHRPPDLVLIPARGPTGPDEPARATPLYWEPAQPVLAAQAEPSASNEGALLARLMDGLAADEALCRALTRRVRGPVAQELSALAQSLRTQTRELSAAYFLVVGTYHVVHPIAPQPSGALGDSLRELFSGTRERTRLYAQGIQSAPDRCAAELYTLLCDHAGQNARQLRAAVTALGGGGRSNSP